MLNSEYTAIKWEGEGVYMKKTILQFLMTILGCLLLFCSGCSREEESTLHTGQKEIVDWKAKKFHVPEEIEMKQSLWTEEFQPWEHEGTVHIASGACRDKLWYFGTGLTDDGMYVSGINGEYVLEFYDCITDDYRVKDFIPAELGLSSELGYLVGMDMIKEGAYMFRWAGYTKDSDGMYSQTEDVIVFSNLEGENRYLDVMECFRAEGLETYTTEILPLWPGAKCHAAGENMIWLMQSENFYLIDESGEIVMQYQGGGMQLSGGPLCTEDGGVILPVYSQDERKYDFLWADVAGKEFTSLAVMEAQTPFISQVYGLYGNALYYKRQNPKTGYGEGIVKWNIETGEQTWIYEFQIGGLSTYQTMLAGIADNQPAMRLLKINGNQARDWVVLLGEEETKMQGDVCIADFTGFGDALAKSTSKASMEIPYLNFTYEDVSAEEKRTRVLAELTNGAGPDILFVSEEDYTSLAENGLLADINTLLKEEIRKEFLPAVVEMAKQGDKLLGLPVGVRAETFVMEQKNRSEWSGAIYSPYVMEGYLSPELAVQKIINYSKEYSFLINPENGKSHFDDERFVHLLELTAKDRSKESAEDYTEKDVVWGYFILESALLDFFSKWDADGITGYLIPENGLVVVNKNTANKEAVSLYLELLFGEEMQAAATQLSLSVRKLVPEDYLVMNDEGELVFMGGSNAIKVPVYEDGTTPLHKAAVFLENCQIAPNMNYQVNRIVAEELSRMSSEGKSAREVAEIIDSRVQLYLDEQR